MHTSFNKESKWHFGPYCQKIKENCFHPFFPQQFTYFWNLQNTYHPTWSILSLVHFLHSGNHGFHCISNYSWNVCWRWKVFPMKKWFTKLAKFYQRNIYPFRFKLFAIIPGAMAILYTYLMACVYALYQEGLKKKAITITKFAQIALEPLARRLIPETAGENAYYLNEWKYTQLFSPLYCFF